MNVVNMQKTGKSFATIVFYIIADCLGDVFLYILHDLPNRCFSLGVDGEMIRYDHEVNKTKPNFFNKNSIIAVHGKQQFLTVFLFIFSAVTDRGWPRKDYKGAAGFKHARSPVPWQQATLALQSD